MRTHRCSCRKMPLGSSIYGCTPQGNRLASTALLCHTTCRGNTYPATPCPLRLLILLTDTSVLASVFCLDHRHGFSVLMRTAIWLDDLSHVATPRIIRACARTGESSRVGHCYSRYTSRTAAPVAVGREREESLVETARLQKRENEASGGAHKTKRTVDNS